jgi:hypothetical protein
VLDVSQASSNKNSVLINKNRYLSIVDIHLFRGADSDRGSVSDSLSCKVRDIVTQ